MIEAETAYAAWMDALSYLLQNGRRFRDVRKRMCIEIENFQVKIHDSRNQLTLPIEHLQSIQDWVYPSLLEIAEIILAKQQGYTYGYAYGARLFAHGGKLNQVNDYVIPLLKADPTSRRAVVTLFDPSEDANPGAENVPGMVLVDFKLRQNRLNVVAFLRSSDMFVGWPANIYQLFVIQEYVAARLDAETGSITTFATSAHVFEDHEGMIRHLLK